MELKEKDGGGELAVSMKVEVESPEKKNRRKTTAKKKKDPSPQPTCPSFSLLPDEITVNCLARIPRSYYPRLSFVSPSFRSLLSSPELYAERSQLGNTEQCLYVCLWDPYRCEFPMWYTLWINPNRNKKKRKKTIGQMLVPIPSSGFASFSSPTVVGSEIYVIGGLVHGEPSSAVRVLDCRSHTWRDAPSMNVARTKPKSCYYDGKIYVMGGLEVDDNESSFAEVFDTKTQTWERLPGPDTEVRKRYIHTIAEFQGKINFGDFCKMFAYDTKQGKWECCVNSTATWNRSVRTCVIENVLYSFREYIFGSSFGWTDINGDHSKDVKGVDSLIHKYKRNGGSISHNTPELASCGGKLYFMWEGYTRPHSDHKKKIWCAEITLEKRDGGEVWGNVEWVDVVHTTPAGSCDLLHCVTVSV